MYQYILFDLDGTLTDPKIGICTCVQYALRDAGIEEENLDVLEPFIGPPLKDSFQEFYHMTSEQAEHAIEKYRERFSTVGLYENDIYAGIEPMLKRLHESGRKLGIASSKPTVFVEKILVHFHIREYFDVVVGSELDGRRGRKEEVVEYALNQLLQGKNKNYDKCVMVGDRKFDIEGAIAHHIDGIGVSYGYGGREELEKAGATYIAENVLQLEELLFMTGKGAPEKGKRSKSPDVLSFYKAWQVLFPFLLYWAISNIILVVGVTITQLFFGSGKNITECMGSEWVAKFSVILNAVAMLGTIPFMYGMYRRMQGQMEGIEKKQPLFMNKRTGILQCVLILIFGASSAIGLNMLFSYIDFGKSALRYQEVSSMQYSVSIPIGILLYGVISPIAEELVFRGLVMSKLRKFYSKRVAIIVSAFIFGMYHGNMVQAVYAFILGILLAICFLKFNHLLIPILFHGAANASVFVLTYDRHIETMVNKPWNCLIFLAISAISAYEIWRNKTVFTGEKSK